MPSQRRGPGEHGQAMSALSVSSTPTVRMLGCSCEDVSRASCAAAVQNLEQTSLHTILNPEPAP